MTKTSGKPTNRWLDVQIVIGTLGMTFSLFLWNIFAGANRGSITQPEANPQVSVLPVTEVNPLPTPTYGTTVIASPTTAPTVPPPSFGTILLGGTSPQVSPGSSSGGPAPVTGTGSSRP
jgi:hypothetical protein